MEISPFDKLDTILYNFTLDNNGIISFFTFSNISDIISRGLLNVDKNRYNQSEVANILDDEIMVFLNNGLVEILDKLEKDKYLQRIASASLNEENETVMEEIYQITFEGRAFYMGGGYVGKFNRETALTKTVRENDRMFRIATVWVAVGTIGLLLFEILKFYLSQRHSCH